MIDWLVDLKVGRDRGGMSMPSTGLGKASARWEASRSSVLDVLLEGSATTKSLGRRVGIILGIVD